MMDDSLTIIRYNQFRFSDWLIIIFFPATLLLPGGGEALILFACLYGLFLLLVGKSSWKQLYNNEKQIILLFLAWFGLKALSVIWSIDLSNIAGNLASNLHFCLALPVMAAIRVTTYEKSRLLLLSVRFTLIIVGLYAMTLYMMGLIDPNPINRFEALAQNPLVFGTITSAMMLWILERFVSKPQFIDLLALLSSSFALYLSYSRGPLIIVALLSMLLLIVYAIWGRQHRKIIWILIALITLTSLYVMTLLRGTAQGFEQIPQSIHKYFTNPSQFGSSIEFRLDMWVSSLKAFAERPWLGYGTGNAHAAAEPFFRYEFPKLFSHVHNMYLQIALEMGTLGIIFTIFWIGLLFRLAIHNRSERLRWGLLTSLLAVYLLNGMTNSVFDQGLLNSFFVLSALILISRDVKCLKIPEL